MGTKTLPRAFTMAVCATWLLMLVGATPGLAAVPIEIFPNQHWGQKHLDAAQINKIVNKQVWNAAREKVKAKTASKTTKSIQDTVSLQYITGEDEYHKAKVKMAYDDTGAADHLVVYLLSKTSYSVETIRVDLDNNYGVSKVTTNYDTSLEDLQYTIQADDSYAGGTCPDTTVDMVFGSTEASDIRTAGQAVDNAAKIGRDAGYNVVTLKDSEENIQNVKDWLACENLIVFGRVGHGYENGIVLDDGELKNDHFESLSSTALNNNLVYFNSCLVHNDPLEPAIVNAGAQKYIGGDVNLSIGPSEDVFICVMDRVINDGDAISTSLTECEQQHYRNQSQVRGSDGIGDHGISGNGSDYLSEANNCSAELNSSSASFDAAGGTGSIDVTINDDCEWTAVSNTDWMTIDSGEEYTGSQTVTYTVTAEAGAQRSGTLTIAGISYTVSQGIISIEITEEGDLDKDEWHHFGPYEALAGDFVAAMTGTNDVDLYVREGAQPTLEDYDCRPYAGDATETCTQEGPGEFYVSVQGYTSPSSSYQLTITYLGAQETDAVCDADHLYLCNSQTTCEDNSLNWCNNECQVDECTVDPDPECGASRPDLCGDQTSCENVGLNWCDNACQAEECSVEPEPVCDADHPNLCQSRSSCEDAGLNWCDDGCQVAACPAPEPVCDQNNPDLCGDQSSCENASLNWCDDACQIDVCPSPSPSTNLALGASVSASSYYNWQYMPYNVNDSNNWSSWASRPVNPWSWPEWIMLDLGGQETVSQVVIAWHSTSYSRGYRISVWQNGSWSTVATKSKSSSGTDVVSFSPKSTGSVLIEMQSPNRYSYGIDEIEIW